MKIKTIIYILFFFILMSCSQKKMITNATLCHYRQNATVELNDKQIGQLNELIGNGLEITDGMKWVYLRTIKFSYEDEKDENVIDLFKSGFEYYIEFNKKYYKVKEPYKHIFKDFIEAK